jgi:ribosomal protein S18 acetylase RimI-like enzyme
MPRMRSYRNDDWDAFLALDLETGLASLRRPTAEERDAFRARWPELLRTRFGWSDTGPTTNDSTFFVLEDDEGGYAGHLWLSEQEDFFTGETALMVTTVAIASSCRGRGWGRLLMDRAVDEARRRGLSAIRLGVDADNEAARKLYEGMGFTTTRLTMERSS